MSLVVGRARAYQPDAHPDLARLPVRLRVLLGGPHVRAPGAYRRAGRGGQAASSGCKPREALLLRRQLLHQQAPGQGTARPDDPGEARTCRSSPRSGSTRSARTARSTTSCSTCCGTPGCRIVYLGLESVNPATLKEYHKESSVDDMAGGLEALANRGIKTHGMFVFGADSDTLESLDADGGLRHRARAEQRPVPGSDPAARHPADGPVRGRGPHLHQELESLRRAPRGLLAQADDPVRAAGGHCSRRTSASTRRGAMLAVKPKAPMYRKHQVEGYLISQGLGARAREPGLPARAQGVLRVRRRLRCRSTSGLPASSGSGDGHAASLSGAAASVTQRIPALLCEKVIDRIPWQSLSDREGDDAWPRSWPSRIRRAAWRRPRPPSTWAWPSRRWATGCSRSTWTPRATSP